MITIIVLFIVFLVLLLAGAPVYLSLLVSSLTAFFCCSDGSSMYIAQTMTGAFSSWALLAIPFFIFAGNVIAHLDMSNRLIRVIRFLTQIFPHRIPLSIILSGIFFAGISGSGPADTAALGSFLFPEMKKDRYPEGLSAVLIASAGSIGIIIPPSIALIIYGMEAQASVSKLFIAGIIPGILVGLALLFCTIILSKGHEIRVERIRPVWKDYLQAMIILIAPLVILGGIYSGFFTPTESAAVAAIYMLGVGLLAGQLKFAQFLSIIWETILNTSSLMLLISSATLFSSIMIRAGLREIVQSILVQTAMPGWSFVLLFNVLLLVLGCLIDAISILYIVTPLLIPVAVNLYGMDPVHLGIIMTVNLAIGQITPPVGVNLFVASSVSKVSVDKMIKPAFQFVFAEIIVLMLISYFPVLSLWTTKWLH